MTNNTYWQTFPTNMVDAPGLLIPQQTPPSHLSHSHHHPQQPQQPQQHPNPQQQQQQPWSDEADKRKWSQEFGEFDINSHANKMFHMDDYNNSNNNSNNDPSEGDSPDSGNGSHRRHDLLSDSGLFQGGDQKQRRKEQNRAAQRAFRERKERYVKELQIKIKEMEKKHNDELLRVTQENDSLKQLVKRMEAEIYTLKGAAMAFNVSINKMREAGLDVQTTSVIRDTPSPPQSVDRHPSPPAAAARPYDRPIPRSSAVATLRDRDGYSATDRHSSIHDPLLDTVNRYSSSSTVYSHPYNRHANDATTDDDLTIEDDEAAHSASFAEREVSRFDHKVDPMMNSGVKMIPCSQIWERLSQHPNFDEFDMDQLCEELKKKAKCSGTGPVIPEFELQEVLRRMDSRQI
ncbi:hypothetical protein FB192DRAFT_1361724 [Mucor lusitanicus]|uniref:BZIP domain-containing protein n=2 Tax=Mucor circinelloides f. lusitanicus TaxID=29924 RepID=A0A8H4BPQ3_MUCCL|nr:hypothetical protein FB192DRAFT_1361724 [Mucor lusitanicus]